MALYDPKVIYDPDTMPLVEGWEETNNCRFVRFHWCLTKKDQEAVDAHWRPLFYRHSLINTKMALATHAGVGVPGWDPYLGVDESALSREEYWALADQSLGTKIARGKPIFPTGLAEDPRVFKAPPPAEVCTEYSCDCSLHRALRGLPPRSAGPDIVQMLRDAAARADEEIRAIHAELVAAWKARQWALKSWAQVAANKKDPEPTLLEAAQLRLYRKGLYREDEWVVRDGKLCRKQSHSWTRPGLWHEWEIVEVLREETRQADVEAAWQRAEARVKSVLGQTWGGGT